MKPSQKNTKVDQVFFNRSSFRELLLTSLSASNENKNATRNKIFTNVIKANIVILSVTVQLIKLNLIKTTVD